MTGGGEEADVCADTQSVMSHAGKRPPQNSGSGTGNSESKSKNKVKLRCQVECYGQGKIHEDILKKLETSSCEGGPGIPCILFVYKVSHEIEDLRNALQWITKNETTQKEDICAVFLLEKISERSEVGEVMITLPDLYHVETKAVRVLWKEMDALWKMGNPFSCPEAIQTVREIIRQRNSQTRQGGEEADVCADVWTDCGSRSVMSAGDSPPGNPGLGRGVQNNSKNKEKLRCQETSSCEGGPGIPCILFVYKVSREIEDLRNALQWITKNETIQKEDICAVFLLEKISEKSKVGEVMITVPDLFHEDTKVVRVLWKEKDALWKMLGSNPFSCPEAIETVREIIRQRSSQTRQGGEEADVCADTQSVMSDAGKRPPQNSGSGTGNSESKSKNKVKLRCQVECYGQGKIHEDILKKLETSSCEGGPGIPCILFVYKVSHEIEDLRNALQWITKNETTQKEDICAVFLLEKISERSEVGEVMITLPDLYHVETKAVRVLWKEMDALWKMLGSNPFSCPEAIQTVREIIRQRSSQTRQEQEDKMSPVEEGIECIG
ncbi:uncharacterized protein [Heptranchias perlo]|uniref:uncharacterized protein n=1 Tax=Heptranchias perlo TaxID=212740 RepID=UPI003559EA58